MWFAGGHTYTRTMRIYLEVVAPELGSRLSDLSSWFNPNQDGNTPADSAILAGVVVLALTIIWGRVEAWLIRRRERKGLLWVIDAEVYENNDVLKEMIHYPDLSEQFASRSTVSADAWQQNRLRLAQLLRPHHVQHLTTYYASIRRIGITLIDLQAKTKPKNAKERARAADLTEKRRTLLSSLANLAWLEGKEIRKMGKKYIGTLPDYFETPKKEAEKAATGDQGEDAGEDIDTEEASPT